MKEIKEISMHIEEELLDAEKYIKCALRYKDSDRQLAEMYYNLSSEEMKHSYKLHDQGVRLINEYKAAGEIVPVSMQAVYDYLHERFIEKENTIKNYQDQYRT